MSSAGDGPYLTLRISNGLLLVRDGVGTWLIQGAADGLVYPAGDRLVWLLPLLESTPSDVSAALPDVPVADTPLPALARFALTAWGEHWPTLALDWLDAGWPTRDLLDVLADMKDSCELSQPLRYRALRLWRASAHA
ncbi:hypothetical protein [Micromonospora saelicesensis]|uniref:Uncharacterized protein n=1 Tax=Micromonospora saelicesensis TaxID=285676 RepID=A0A1C4Z317_9ACTN|nr:hypothetical protein [Micromonospora saelicesensis]RAO42621.1 hypothetical protein GAR06_05147 [Micromonospora saelicesensis]RAO42837.1 hypothetical protein PSN01_06089 [Micromonospora saelicesensis]SCF27419.1 hypothetical protein GA0070561_4872 [Micromonospora saelicesensis]